MGNLGRPEVSCSSMHDIREAILAGAGGEEIAAIYVTTLRRTAETAAPLAARLGLTPRVEPEMI